MTLITVYLPLLFPDGRLPGARWRPVSWAAVGCGVIAASGLAIAPGVVVNLRALRNPFETHPVAVSDTAIAVGLAGLLGCVVVAVWSLLVRARRATSLERQQIKWLACAGCLVAATLVPSTILSLSTGTAARIAKGALMIAIVTVPVAVAVAVLKYRLYDIDRVISRTLAYASVTGLLAGIYAGLVLLATQLLRFSSPVAVTAATLAAAALFNPIRRRVQRGADRRFNRARYDAETTVAAFAARLKGAMTWMPSAMTWPASCRRHWNRPPSGCGLASTVGPAATQPTWPDWHPRKSQVAGQEGRGQSGLLELSCPAVTGDGGV